MLNTLKEIATSLNELFKNKLEEVTQRKDYQEEVYRKQLLNYKIYFLMLIIQDALYEVLGHRNFLHIKNISTAADIRIVNYCIENNGYIYIFEIAKENASQKVSDYHLELLRQRINSDIYRMQQK